MYQRHSIVVTKAKTWCTIESPTPLSMLEAMSQCTVRLIYLGDLNFGVLRWKPRKPTAPCPRLGEFDIVEEITIDKQPIQGRKLAVVRPTPVETPAINCGPSVDEISATSVNNVQIEQNEAAITTAKPQAPIVDSIVKPKVVYAAENSDFYVETSVNQQGSSSAKSNTAYTYPWKKKLVVSVRRLSDFELSYWTGNRVHQDTLPLLKVEPDTPDSVPAAEDGKEVNQQVIEYPPPPSMGSHRKLHSAKKTVKDVQTTEELIEHAKSLISHVSDVLGTSDLQKTYVNTPTSFKPGRKASTVADVSGSLDQEVPVETAVKPKHRTIKCQLCSYVCNTVAELNTHHKI